MLARIFLLLLFFSASSQAAWDLKTHTHAKGAKLVFLQQSQLPIVDIRATFQAGSMKDDSLHGLAKLTNSLLEEGTETRSAQDLSTCFGDIGAETSFHTGREMAYVQIRMLNKEEVINQGLTCLVDLLTKPSFEKDAIERVKAQFKNRIDRENALPEPLALKTLLENIYQDSPYAHSPLGNHQTIKTIQRQDIKTFHKQYYTPQSLKLVVVGDTNFTQAKSILDELVRFLPIQEQQPSTTKTPSFKATVAANIEKGFSQATLLMAKPTISRTHPDWPALVVANHAIGGSGLSSMLSETIREKHGLAYHVYSVLHTWNAPTIWLTNIKSKTEAIEKSRTLAVNLWQKTIEQGVSMSTFKRAQKHLLGQFARRTMSQAQILDELSTLSFYNLPFDYYDVLIGRIKQLTLQEVNQVLQREGKGGWAEVVVK